MSDRPDFANSLGQLSWAHESYRRWLETQARRGDRDALALLTLERMRYVRQAARFGSTDTGDGKLDELIGAASASAIAPMNFVPSDEAKRVLASKGLDVENITKWEKVEQLREKLAPTFQRKYKAELPEAVRRGADAVVKRFMDENRDLARLTDPDKKSEVMASLRNEFGSELAERVYDQFTAEVTSVKQTGKTTSDVQSAQTRRPSFTLDMNAMQTYFALAPDASIGTYLTQQAQDYNQAYGIGGTPDQVTPIDAAQQLRFTMSPDAYNNPLPLNGNVPQFRDPTDPTTQLNYDSRWGRRSDQRQNTSLDTAQTANYLDAVEYLKGLSSSQLTRVQQHLAAAGLINPNTLRAGTLMWGYLDPETTEAWAQLLEESARTDSRNPIEVLAARQRSYAPILNRLLSGESMLAEAGGSSITVSLSDPDTVKQRASDAYRELLGREPTDAEKSVLVKLIHDAEAAAGRQRASGAAQALDARAGGATVGARSAAQIYNDIYGFGHTPGVDGDADTNVRKILAAIAEHESGGNPRAQNPVSSASGKYQFIDRTWQNLNPGSTPRAFQASEAEQDAVAYRYAMSIYQNYIAPGKVGWEGIPNAWYVGNPMAGGNYHPDGPGNPETVSGFAQNILTRAFGRDGVGGLDPLQQATDGGEGGVPGLGPISSLGDRLGSATAAINLVEDVDVAASIAEQAKKDHPDEYEAQQIGTAYNELVDLLTSTSAGGLG